MNFKTNFRVIGLLSFMVVFFLAGCTDKPADPVQAGALDQKFYEMIKAKDFEQASMLFSKDEDPVQWESYLKEQHALLGDLISYEIKDTVVNTILTGNVYISRYKTKYTNGDANEVLTVREDVNFDGIKVVMYKVNPRKKNLPTLPSQAPAQ
jgi:hypothetical protein